jgi:hypothetical protein
MSSKLEAIRAAFKNNSSTTDDGDRRPNNYYPFWNIETDTSVTVRFLPDLNEDNPMQFVVEKAMHTLVINGENKSVPCMKMYGHDCPICKVSSQFYKEEGKGSINGKKYWRKKQHLAQALIIEDSIPAKADSTEKYEGTVRYLNIGWQLFGVIDQAFKSGDLDEVPYDYDDGCNFIITKTDQGGYASYALGSRFARKTTALTPDQLAMVEDSLVDLSTLLPPEPDMAMIESMLAAALSGGGYDEASDEAGSAPAPKVKRAAPVEETDDEEEQAEVVKKPKAKPAPVESSDDDDEADAILAAIQKRRSSKQ